MNFTYITDRDQTLLQNEFSKELSKSYVMNHSYDSCVKNLDQDKAINQEAFGIGKFLKGNIQLGTYHLEHPISNIRLSDLTHQDSPDYSYLGRTKSQNDSIQRFDNYCMCYSRLHPKLVTWLEF